MSITAIPNAGVGMGGVASFTAPSFPLSIAGWMYIVSDISSNRRLVSLKDSGGVHFVDLRVTGGVMIGLSYDNGTVRNSGGRAPTTGAWNHFAAVFNGSGSTITSIQSYINGTADTPLTSFSATGPNGAGSVICWGSDPGTSTGELLSSDIADFFCVWTVALSGSDITNLQSYYPNNIQNASIWNYWNVPNTTDPNVPVIGSVNIHFPSGASYSSNEPSLSNPSSGNQIVRLRRGVSGGMQQLYGGMNA